MTTADNPPVIADDDEELRDTLARRFTRAGMPVITAESGEEALAKIDRAELDVALFDLHLPGMSGLDLLARFKQAQPGAEVLMLTAHGSIETAIEAMRRGAYDYLSKPFQLSDLEIHVDKAYEKSRLARRQRQWEEQVRFESPRYRLVGSTPAMKRVVALIERVAPADATVLVHGPSGSGKGNKVQAARALGISRRALYRLIAKYHLGAPGTRPAREGAPTR